MRLANCLSELLLLPLELKENSHCRMIQVDTIPRIPMDKYYRLDIFQNQFATSFKQIIEFENLPNERETHEAFNEALSEYVFFK